jgi:glycosyltransferase involved in cell wall biosynthesis
VRIGLVIYGSLDTLSGGFLYDRTLVESLRSAGDQVETISLPWRSYARHLNDNLSRALHRRLCDARLDILLQDELNHPSLFWLNRRLKGRAAYPIVSIVHHLRCLEVRPMWQNRFYRWVEQSYLGTANSFVFNSEATRAAVQALVGDRQTNVVAYPGGDRLHPKLTPRQISARAQQRGPLRILFIGNVIPRKELHTLLSALARLPQENWRLEVVGNLTVDTSYAQSIRRQIAASGLTRQVALLGPLPDPGLSERLTASHVLAGPSSYEGFGIVYLEGMGFGLPPIASNAGGASEFIAHGREGFLVNPGDLVALAQHVQELIQDRQRLTQMSLAALERYRAHPTWAEGTRNIRSFLQTLVK